jgi:hypothetical protein
VIPIRFINKTLNPGDVFTLKDKDKDAIKGLLAEGKVKPYCDWLKDAVDVCQLPCTVFSKGKTIHSCNYFKVWGERRNMMDTHLPAQTGNINKDETYDIDEGGIL